MSIETTNLSERPMCALCLMTNTQQWAVADAQISNGQWGYVCDAHFRFHRCELGTGRGQLIVIDDYLLTDEIQALREEAQA